MPPTPGMDKAGVMSFRNMADCERIKGAVAGDARKAAVILK